MKEENQLNLLLLLATFKSFSEQLYNLKGEHSGLVKKKFNMLMNAASSYERTIDEEWLKENKSVIEDLNDSVTDFIYTLRDESIKRNTN
jgi:hypothetical protein|tara:strand:- start:235 stop:501 length:267 start_codon:yes stop_codon:yes gene_type:complete